MRKVFVTNASYHDFRPAEVWGKLIFMTEGEVDKFDIGSCMRAFQAAMRDSHAEDFLIPVSLPILCGLASGILAAKHGKVNYLLYSNRDRRYVQRTVVFDKDILARQPLLEEAL